MTAEKKRGRPKKYQSATERMQSFRERKLAQGKRLDGYISASADWRLETRAWTWQCSRPAAIERLIMEADEKYGRILFPAGQGEEE